LCTRAPRLTENRKRRRERCSQCARLDQESPPNNKKGLVASLTKTHQRASYGLAPSFQARFTSISRLVARKPLARYGATQGRARSRLAPPATLQISQWSWGGVSSSCRRGINSGCRLTFSGRSCEHSVTGSLQVDDFSLGISPIPATAPDFFTEDTPTADWSGRCSESGLLTTQL
jgi:hypothetical protein